ncbi:MAG: hypothetical protein ACFCUI_00670 [Bernardetiaceae bacterium]
MFVPFDQLPDDARLWFYVASRPFLPEELPEIEAALESFVADWKAHQIPLQASFQIFARQVIILGVDTRKTSPSGCAIDASVSALRALEQRFALNLLDQGKILFRHKDQHHITTVSTLKKAIANQYLQAHTPVLNTLAQTKAEWEQQPLPLAQDTWLKRYFS